MFNLLSQHTQLFKITALLAGFVIIGFLVSFGLEIFTKEDVYYSTFGAIVQGFIGLVAFLGAVAVFKIELEDQAMQKLSDSIEPSVMHYKGIVAKTLTPTQMLNACNEVLEWPEDYGNRDSIRKVKEKMEETLASRGEVRNWMVDFTIVSFLNVSLAIIGLLFTPIFSENWDVGGTFLIFNVYFSIFTLYTAFRLVRKTMGYSFKLSLSE